MARFQVRAAEVNALRFQVQQERWDSKGIRIQIPDSATVHAPPGQEGAAPFRDYYGEGHMNPRTKRMEGFGARGLFFMLSSVETLEDGSVKLHVYRGNPRHRFKCDRLAVFVSADETIRWRRA